MKTPTPARLLLIVAMLAITGWLGWVGGPSNAFDRQAILRMMDFRTASHGLTAVAIAATWLGSAYVTLGGAAATAAWRWLRMDRRTSAWILFTVGGGRLLADGLKLLVDRPRPAFAPYPVPISSLSFPSGHATNSMLAFGALALALAPSRWRSAALGAAVLLSIAIGLTRPYLGVHWPSDILGGWMLGGAILLFAAPFRKSASPAEA